MNDFSFMPKIIGILSKSLDNIFYFGKVITKSCFSKGLISALYKMLVSESKESSNCKLDAWRLDLEEDISTEDWMKMCEEAQSLTMNTRLNLLQYKWLMRICITPVLLHKYNENIPDTCLRCMDLDKQNAVSLYTGI